MCGCEDEDKVLKLSLSLSLLEMKWMGLLRGFNRGKRWMGVRYLSMDR